MVPLGSRELPCRSPVDPVDRGGSAVVPVRLPGFGTLGVGRDALRPGHAPLRTGGPLSASPGLSRVVGAGALSAAPGRRTVDRPPVGLGDGVGGCDLAVVEDRAPGRPGLRRDGGRPRRALSPGTVALLRSGVLLDGGGGLRPGGVGTVGSGTRGPKGDPVQSADHRCVPHPPDRTAGPGDAVAVRGAVGSAEAPADPRDRRRVVRHRRFDRGHGPSRRGMGGLRPALRRSRRPARLAAGTQRRRFRRPRPGPGCRRVVNRGRSDRHCSVGSDGMDAPGRSVGALVLGDDSRLPDRPPAPPSESDLCAVRRARSNGGGTPDRRCAGNSAGGSRDRGAARDRRRRRIVDDAPPRGTAHDPAGGLGGAARRRRNRGPGGLDRRRRSRGPSLRLVPPASPRSGGTRSSAPRAVSQSAGAVAGDRQPLGRRRRTS